MQQVIEAADLLEKVSIATNIWSVTSYSELTRDGLAVERENRLQRSGKKTYVEQLLDGCDGVFVAASDYMKALPLGIARWIPGRYAVLGTDGYGVSESRPDLRDHFEVSAKHIAYTALATLVDDGKLDENALDKAAGQLGINRDKLDPAVAGPAQVVANRD